MKLSFTSNNQAGLQRYVALKNLLQETDSAATCHEMLAGYEDIDTDRLTVQLAMARQQQWDNVICDRSG